MRKNRLHWIITWKVIFMWIWDKGYEKKKITFDQYVTRYIYLELGLGIWKKMIIWDHHMTTYFDWDVTTYFDWDVLLHRRGRWEKIDYIGSSRDKLHLSGIGTWDIRNKWLHWVITWQVTFIWNWVLGVWEKWITLDHHVTSKFIWSWD